MRFVQVRVEEYAGHRAAERPLAFHFQGDRYEVVEVVDRWMEGGLDPRSEKIDYFKVRTRDEGVYILRYLALFDAWSLLV